MAATPIYTLPYIADHAGSFLHEHAPQAKGGIEQMALDWWELLEAKRHAEEEYNQDLHHQGTPDCGNNRCFNGGSGGDTHGVERENDTDGQLNAKVPEGTLQHDGIVRCEGCREEF
jgi:hypothetical protein